MLGDFVKGPLKHNSWPKLVVQGLRHHRAIDAYVDRHPISQHRLKQMPKAFRRWAPILFDLANDHFLAIHWSRYQDQVLAYFCDQVYLRLTQHQLNLPKPAQATFKRLQTNNGLAHYHRLETVDMLLQRLAQRSDKHQSLLLGQQVFRDNYQALEQDFFALFEQMIAFAQGFNVAPQN